MLLHDHLFTMFEYLWSAFGLYWFAAAARGRSPSGSAHQTGEPHFFRVVRLSILAATFALLFWHRSAIGFLGRRFIPDFPALDYAGFIAILIGLGIATWARIHLGTNWSGVVTLKEGHELIRTGPYRNIRHPIYTGILIAFFGNILQLGQVRGLITLAIIWLSFYIKARREESFLRQEFGPKFDEHIRHTGMFLPKFS